MTSPNDWNAKIVDEFRKNNGIVGGPFQGLPLLLLHTTGAKSGAERINPVAYQRIDDRTRAVFASKAGAPTNPDWYYNVLVHPDVTIEVGTETLPASACGDRRGARPDLVEAEAGCPDIRRLRNEDHPGDPRHRDRTSLRRRERA